MPTGTVLVTATMLTGDCSAPEPPAAMAALPGCPGRVPVDPVYPPGQKQGQRS